MGETLYFYKGIYSFIGNYPRFNLNAVNREIKLVISCQKHNLESILTDYIYRISYKIAIKANPVKWIYPY